MAGTGKTLSSLRFSRREIERLTIVLALSLATHLIGVGGYEAGKHLFPWLHWLARAEQAPPPVQDQEPPLEFAMVEQPTTEPPKNAKYYGPQNSRAADETRDNQDQAKINGTQTEIPKVEDTPRTDKLQPQQQPSLPPVAQPIEPGDLVVARKQEPQPQSRPQKLSQVTPHSQPGPKMSQNGGARELRAPSLDVKGTVFGQYDQKFVEAVSQRWYDLLDSQQFALDRTGKVVLRFHLNYDGTISDMIVVQNTVGELLGHVCEDAIHEPAPYAAWSDEMRHQIGNTYREVTFTFYY